MLNKVTDVDFTCIEIIRFLHPEYCKTLDVRVP